MINEHASNPVRPHKLGRYSLRARSLLREQWTRHVRSVPVLYGFESSLLPGGGTDLTAKLASHSQMVIASRHWVPAEKRDDAKAVTRLFVDACANDEVDVLGHPNRTLEEAVGVDWTRVFDAAADSGTAVEVNLNVFPTLADEPVRYGAWATWLGLLGKSGAPVFIGSDVHNLGQLDRLVRHWRKLDDKQRPNPLRDLAKALDGAGIKPQRVVNANLEGFTDWLALAKDKRA
jgi:histidinol phosphatase-like PHP family hydrolase